METNVYTSPPNALLEEVTAKISKEKIGSILIVDNDHLLGILTTTDLLNWELKNDF